MPHSSQKYSEGENPDHHTGKPPSLSARLPRNPNIKTPRAHPQGPKIVELAAKCPAKSLDRWFDDGLQLARSKSAGGNQSPGVRGWSAVPAGYKGFDETSALISTVREELNVKVWPVRVDLADEDCERAKPWTLYHYTHKKSFNEFVKIFSQYDDPEKSRRNYIRLLERDHLSRHLELVADNPHNEPELSLLEPTRFFNKREILEDQFAGEDYGGMCDDGIPFSKFADYCIAFRVPESACFNMQPRFDDGTGMSVSTRVRIAKEELAELIKKDAVSNVKSKNRKSLAHGHDEHTVKKCYARCMTLIFGSPSEDEPDYWDEEGGSSSRHKHHAKPRVDAQKAKVSREWLKEHFVNVQETKKRIAHENGEYDDEADSPTSPSMVMTARSIASMFDISPTSRSRSSADEHHHEMYETYKKRETDHKAETRAANSSVKKSRAGQSRMASDGFDTSRSTRVTGMQIGNSV